jgi:DNA-directed RNA polymerase subunit N
MPIRCFSCGKPIAHLWEEYNERISKGEKPEKIVEKLGLKRYCCRRMLLSHRDYIDDILKYEYK